MGVTQSEKTEAGQAKSAVGSDICSHRCHGMMDHISLQHVLSAPLHIYSDGTQGDLALSNGPCEGENGHL